MDRKRRQCNDSAARTKDEGKNNSKIDKAYYAMMQSYDTKYVENVPLIFGKFRLPIISIF